MATTLQQLAEITACELDGDGQQLIDGVGSLTSASICQVTFHVNTGNKNILNQTGAGAVILTREEAEKYNGNKLICDDPHLTFVKVAHFLQPADKVVSGAADSAVIDTAAHIASSACIGPGCVVGAGVKIGERVVIGANTVIGPGVCIGNQSQLDANITVYQDCNIGQRCRIAAGTVIGGSGFGYLYRDDSWLQVPQLGRVLIGDDVNIGANTTIDRGTIDDTIISDGVKIDNLIQIAHNVIIGTHTILAGCVGIAGSAVIGSHCKIGGRASIAGHIKIVDHVTVMATSLVTKSINNPGVYSSALPVKPVANWRRAVARLNQFDILFNRLKSLEKQNKK